MKRISYFILIIAAFITGCEKSFESFSPNQNNAPTDTLWAGSAGGNFTEVNTLHQNLVRPPLIDSFNLAALNTITFPDNIRIEIPANAFTANGAVPVGKALIEMILLKGKGDFIRFRKPTTSNGYLLESGGSFNLQVIKNDQPLSLSPGKVIKVSYNDPLPNPLMSGFSANGNIIGTGASVFNWQRDTSIVVRATQVGYEIYTNKLNWINCDYFRDTAELKTRIALILPNEFTNANTSAFIVFKNIRAVMQMDADAANRIWRKDKVPVMRHVIYVTITKRGDSYYLGTKETTTATNQNIELRPEKKSLQEIKNFMDGL